ncbi:MarR family winged helix-turn-helix transcriptional regulator [Isoptericola jiangsuensis]|uniref:MarR family winged helix-turn-helix transcriptional regulator n=1 Tax=Isoptericola jiangsuensis TaxID=548579 RepID=UPI003AAAE081
MEDRSETRWLSAEQRDAWIAFVAASTWLPDALDTQLRRDADLSHVEYRVLSWISMHPRRSRRMSEIAALANASLSHLSRIVARLEKRGWVLRTPDPDDGRATLASLTDAGWVKVVESAPGHVEEVQRLVFDNLTAAQVHQLREICELVLHAARPDLCLPHHDDAAQDLE